MNKEEQHTCFERKGGLLPGAGAGFAVMPRPSLCMKLRGEEEVLRFALRPDVLTNSHKKDQVSHNLPQPPDLQLKASCEA